MRRFVFSLLLCVGIAAAVAHAQVGSGLWAKATGEPGASTVCTVISPSAPDCYYLTSSDVDSVVLQTSFCSTVVATLNPDIAGTNTGCEAQIRGCDDGVASLTECWKILQDSDGDGAKDDETLTGDETVGRHAIAFWARFFMVEIIENAGSDACRVHVACFP